MSKLKLDLHNIYNKNKEIEVSLNEIIQTTIENKIYEVEIIPAKAADN